MTYNNIDSVVSTWGLACLLHTKKSSLFAHVLKEDDDRPTLYKAGSSKSSGSGAEAPTAEESVFTL